jgi:quinol monooxygenase YgiN
MIIVIANVRVVPNRLEEALSLSRRHVAQSQTEEGCIAHSVYEDPDQENHLVFLEEWESEESVKAHIARPATGEFVNTLLTMAVGRPKFRLYLATELPFPKSAA